MFDKLITLQIKYSKLLLILLLLIIGLNLYIAKDLTIDPDFSALVSKDSQFNTNDRKLTNAFGSNDAVIVLIKQDRNSIITNSIADMSDPRISQYSNELIETLKQSSYVKSVSSPQLSEDNNYLMFILSLETPEYVGSFDVVLTELNMLLSEAGSPPGIDTTITGTPVLANKISSLLIEDSLKTVLIAIAFIFIILYSYSRNLTYTLITVSTAVISLIFLASSMVLFNINITITLAAVGVLILGLGADYGIHIATHYLRARKEYDDHEKALRHTIEMLRLPITASFVTTFAGFSALILGVSPSSQAQGIVLSLGIAIIYATTFVFFPIAMTVFYKNVVVKSNFVFDNILKSLGLLASYQIKHSKTVLSILGIITIVMIYGATKVEFSTSNSNWIPDNDPISQSFNEINYAYGENDVITLVLESNKGDLRDSQVKRDIDRLILVIEGVPNIDYIQSPYEGLSYDNFEIYDTITNTPLKSSFNHDYTLTTINIYSQNIKQDEAGKSIVLQEIKNIVETYPVHNTDISFYGDVVRFDELGDSLQKDTMVTSILGLGLVFFVASAIYASLSVGLLALIPIIVAVIWAIGLMGFLSVPFTSLSTGIISLVLGVGVDFSIHLVDGIKKYLGRAYNLKDAINKTLTTSGKAIFLSSLTTFFGFLSLAFANLLGTQRLGFSLSISIFCVFVVSITFVPAVMSILHKREQKKLNLTN